MRPASACEVLLSHLSDKHNSHISFPGRSEAFADSCRLMAKEQTHWFFSHNFSLGWLKRPGWRRYFSHIKFLVCTENAVCARSRNAKQSQSQPRKVIWESLPLLHLNHHDAASFYFENREKYPEKRQFSGEFIPYWQLQSVIILKARLAQQFEALVMQPFLAL